MIRLLVATPLILTGQAVTTVAYKIAGAEHLNPYRRSDRPRWP